MKQIYLVLTDTGTILSKIIKIFMKDEYAHVSLALDKTLNPMYSFGRLNPYNAFRGGFVHEYIDKGTFKRFKNTKAIVMVIDVSDEQYEKIKSNILDFENNNKAFKFNTLGLFEVYFNIKRDKQNYLYCAEFVKYILENSDLNFDLPEIIRPEHFKDIQNSKIIYTGLLREYK